MDSKWRIIVSWSEEDGAYVAEVPDLPGCMADGQTRGEAVASVEIAIREWIETAEEMGQAVPPDPAKSRERRLGGASGKSTIIEDDDSHLEDFKECPRNKHGRTKRRNKSFVPERDEIEEFRPEQLKDFVDYWSRFYKYSVKLSGSPEEVIDYHRELNIRDGSLCNLTKENIQRLLRWKLPRKLTDVH